MQPKPHQDSDLWGQPKRDFIHEPQFNSADSALGLLQLARVRRQPMDPAQHRQLVERIREARELGWKPHQKRKPMYFDPFERLQEPPGAIAGSLR